MFGDGMYVSPKASGTINGYRFVALIAGNLLVQATGPRANIVGVTGQNGADDGAPCDFLVPGQVVAFITAGGTFKAGDPLTSDANGKAVKAVRGDRIGGYAYLDAVAGDIAGVILATSGTKGSHGVKALAAWAANDTGPAAADIVDGAWFTLPGGAAAPSTVTLPNPVAPNALDDGLEIVIFHDGTNAQTITYRDATGPVTLSAAATLSKRHVATCSYVGGKWYVDLAVAP